MRRLVVVGLLLLARTVSAQINCITQNGINQCAAPLRLFDSTQRRVSTPVLDLTQIWNDPTITFTGTRVNITDTNSASGSLLADWQVNGVSKFSITKTGAFTTGGLLGLGTTSTSGFTLNNLTPSTATTTVQISPAFRQCGTAYNSTSAASETDCFFTEVLPATVAGTTTALFKLGVSIAGGAATYPFTMTNGGALTIDNVTTAATAGYRFAALGYLTSTSNGVFGTQTANTTIGVTFKADALPTVSSCGAGSPAVVAGSTPLSGSVTIGTTAVATCLITFNGTAFPSAPHCSGAVETTSAAAVRAMGYLASTTTLTIVPTAAWVDSSVVNWTCISSK